VNRVNVVLFTWNPDKWQITDRAWAREVQQILECGYHYGSWSTGNSTKAVKPGDTAFLLRQHSDRGIVAKGVVTSDVYQEAHWNPDAEEDDVDNYVDITWTQQLPIASRLTIEVLKQKLPEVHWSPQGSGTTVPPAMHEKLNALWDQTVRKSGIIFGVPAIESRPNRTPAHPDLVLRQNGQCHACHINPQNVYNADASHLLVNYRGPNDSQDVALCANCFTIATLNTPHLSIGELERRIAMHF
jgi:hypothetical protein